MKLIFISMVQSNKQNCCYWAAENPREIHQKPLHSPKVTVWCALGKNCIIGPYFFEQNGVTVTVTAEHYIEMLNTFFLCLSYGEGGLLFGCLLYTSFEKDFARLLVLLIIVYLFTILITRINEKVSFGKS